MSDSRQDLIDAAVKVYGGDLEKSSGARQWLEEITAGASEGELHAAAERLRQVDGTEKAIPWRRIFLAISILIVAIAAYPAARINLADKASRSASGSASAESAFGKHFSERLSPSEQLLIGDSRESVVSSRKRLWESAPSNPAYFAEYAVAHAQKGKSLLPGYEEMANRLDPDNSWFDYFGAGVVANGSLKKVDQTKAEKENEELARWEITDRTRYQLALEIMSRARGKLQFNSYEEEMMRRRMPLLPQTTPQERAGSMHYLYSSTASYMQFIKLSEVIRARAFELEEAGDREGFRGLLEDTRDLILRMSEDPVVSLIQELVLRSIIRGTTMELKVRAERLGLAAEAGWVVRWNEGVERLKEEKERNKDQAERISQMVEREGTYYAALALPIIIKQSPNPQPLDRGGLMPGRLMDYYLAARVSSGLLVIFLSAVVGLAFLYRFRSSLTVRLMASRVEKLLTPVDWWWIFGVGVLLPVLITVSLMLSAPFNGWDVSLRGVTGSMLNILLSFFQFAGLGLLLVIVPLLIIRWRFRLKAGAFSFRSSTVIGWLVVIYIVTAIVGLGTIKPDWVLPDCGGAALVWLIVIIVRAVFSSRELILQRVAISRVILPAWVMGMLLMTVSFFAFQAARLYWFERDELMELKIREPGPVSYEYRQANQMRAELVKMLRRTP